MAPLRAGTRLLALADSSEPQQRRFVAQVIGEVGMDNFYQPLLSLLQDPDSAVRAAALASSSRVVHPRLVPLLIESLALSETRSAAIDALVAGGDLLLPFASKALADETSVDADMTRRLVRIGGQVKSKAVMALLEAHIDHPDREIQR